ncbi:tripeptidyl peptidase A [Wolfiporia cocos MD-104 SS10]|uniref:tripeptidyl-peptidase II n=1 Tax=Wolfiporia cocos (strain MD-104) TaxID=742152 RepID=A0A2H3JZA7_WOLCO|nr:tripeptidyl peptidase A [Wolfiporia cocos MD-104 SS10]
MRTCFLALILTVTSVAAAPSSVRECQHKVKETINPPRGWTKVKPAPADHTIELRIGLPQSNFALLEQDLYQVSDPFHERYGAHLSKEEVDALIAPQAESVDLVDEWLASHGIATEQLSRSSARDWIKIKVPVSLVEDMLKTEYHVWVHEESGEAMVRTTSYSLPEYLLDHVDVIQPTTMFARFKGQATSYWFAEGERPVVDLSQPYIPIPSAYNGEVNASCNGSITPTCLKELYNAVGYVPQAADKNHIACTGYLDQYADFEDFKLFNEALVPEAANSTFEVIYINGGENSQNLSDAGIEADLDTQYAFGLTYPTPRTFYTTGGSPPYIPDDHTPENSNEPYANWLEYIMNVENPPQTISTSYGDDEQTVPESYAKRVCAELAQLGARGVSLIFSSGDYGVGDGDPNPATQQCYTNNGLNETRFIPEFPATCPYVTAVGATWYLPERAYYISGGGFSNYFARPWWQNYAVPTYLDKLAPGTYAGLYNASGRAIPDVSAQGQWFKIFVGGEEIYIGGTSAAAPTTAAMVSLLNDARLANGLSPLGYLNPFIYAIGQYAPKALNDITVGNNPGCGTEGFNATVGWDPVTGYGTPNFYNLKDVALGNLTAIRELL